jgi:hypothetical protein
MVMSLTLATAVDDEAVDDFGTVGEAPTTASPLWRLLRGKSLHVQDRQNFL